MFADLTFHITDRFNTQVGGRESENRQTYSETLVGPYDNILVGLPSPIVNPEQRTKDSSVTYLVTPQFKLTPNAMIYSRLSSGYRAGGPNPTSAVHGLPPRFAPDTTKNYEIGAKGSVLENTLSLDVSLYHIDWKDIQLSANDPVTSQTYYLNASRAKSEGIELSMEARPLRGLKVASWVAWNNAVLTENFPSSGAAKALKDDRLPNSSRFSGSISIDHEWSVTSSLVRFVGGSVSLVGDRMSFFTPSGNRQQFPSYTKADLRTGATYDNVWTINGFVTNVADKRGLIGAESDL